MSLETMQFAGGIPGKSVNMRDGGLRVSPGSSFQRSGGNREGAAVRQITRTELVVAGTTDQITSRKQRNGTASCRRGLGERTQLCSVLRRESSRGERSLQQFGEMESLMTLITAALLEWMDLRDHCGGLRSGWEVRRGAVGIQTTPS